MKNDSLSNSRKVLNQLHSLIKVIDTAGDKILHAEMSLGFSQFKILTVLRERPLVSQATIASLLNLTAPAISRHTDILLHKGLVTMKVNPKNKREHLLALTAAGGEALSKSWDLLDSRFTRVIKILTTQEQQQLIDMLDKLFRQLLRHKGNELTDF
jgi:DNA-binding MarR family transcriptional regulator